MTLKGFLSVLRRAEAAGCIDNNRSKVKIQPGVRWERGRGGLACGDTRNQMRTKVLDLSRLALIGL